MEYQFDIDGGLDLTTPKTSAAPGTMADCQNFEIGRVKGATRVDGFIGFDGSVEATRFKLVAFSYVSFLGYSVTPMIGERVWFEQEGSTTTFTTIPSATGVVVGVASTSGLAYAVFPSDMLTDYVNPRVFAGFHGFELDSTQIGYSDSIAATYNTNIPYSLPASAAEAQHVRFRCATGFDSGYFPTLGEAIYFGSASTVTGLIQSIFDPNDGSPKTFIAAFSPGITLPTGAVAMHMVSQGQQNSATIDAVTLFPGGSGESYNDAIATVVAATAARITEVPGRTPDALGDDEGAILGHTLYKDDEYAVKDYKALVVRSVGLANTTLVLEGARVYTDDASYWADIVRPEVVYGDWTVAASECRLVIKDEHGAIETDGTTYDLYLTDEADEFICGGSALGVPMGAEHTPGVLTQISTTSEHSTVTSAGMYKSGIAGWTPIDMLREVQFRGGGVALEELALTGGYQRNSFSLTQTGQFEGGEVLYDDTGFLVPANATAIRASTGWATWANIGNLTLDDGNTADSDASSAFLAGAVYVSGFGTSTIPENATITGVEVTIEHRQVAAGTEFATEAIVGITGFTGYQIPGVPKLCSLLKNDDANPLPGSLTVRTLGAQNDLWGENTITVAQVKDPSFGVYVQFSLYQNAGTLQVKLDCIKVKVHYINASSYIYFKNAAALANVLSYVPARVIRVTKTAGAYDAGTAQGYITIIAPTNAYSEGLQRGAALAVATTNRARTAGISTMTTAAHLLVVGQTVVITGMTDTTFNGTWVVLSVPSTTTFTFYNGLEGTDVASGADVGGTVTPTQYTALTPRRISDGDQIWSANNGSGTNYGTASSNDFPVTLPSQSEMEAEESRYVFTNQNFWAQAKYLTMFGANGAGPAFGYDGVVFIRIHTELIPEADKPRQVCKHGPALVLGYASGKALFSAILDTGADPYNFESVENGVVVQEFGARITGLLPLKADVLGVFCDNKIIALHGLVSSSFVAQLISPNSGAIEYTVVDMGLPVFCDYFGISTLDVTDAFGNFLAGRQSFPIWPWLQPRVQALTESPQLRPVMAWPVRNKNQYCVAFQDAYILKMSLWGPQRTPMFSLSRFARPIETYAEGETVGSWPIWHVSSGIMSTGRERIFMSTYDGYQTATAEAIGTLYEYDVGRTFNGEEIQSWVTLNWTSVKSATTFKKFRDVLFFGQASTYATFYVSRVPNYGISDIPTTNVQPGYFGLSTDPASFLPVPAATSVSLSCEGLNIQHRVDITSATIGPFTLQTVVLEGVESAGPSNGRVR